MEEDIITRYMSIEKALHFLKSKQLYLARYDSFEDQMEGYATSQLATKFKQEPSDKPNFRLLRAEERKRLLYGSCWFTGCENLYMWDRYKTKSNVAVQLERQVMQSHFNLSKSSMFIPNFKKRKGYLLPKLKSVRSGNVEYWDEANEDPSKEYIFGFVKHSSFSHEKEFRFVVRQQRDKEQVRASSYLYKIPLFENKPIVIRINPYMSDVYIELIQSFLDKNKILNVEVVKSKFSKHFK